MTLERRGQNPGGKKDPERFGLPIRPFLYTLDQLATILSLKISTLKMQYIFYEGRSTGTRSLHLMSARNIAPPTNSPDWRVAEKELLRWMRLKGFRIYELEVVTH